MKPPKAVIFDLDGVLVHTEPLHESTWRDTFEQFGIELSPRDYAWLQGRPAEQVATWLKKRPNFDADAIDFDRLIEMKRAKFDAGLDEGFGVVPGAGELLRRLKGDLPLGLVSSAKLRVVGRILLICNWRAIFEALVGAEHVVNPKPHPEPYEKAAARLKVAPGDCLVFEDSPIGIESARRAGAMVCGVATTLSPRELRIHGAHWTLRDFTDEKTLAEALAGRRSAGLLAGLRRMFSSS